MGVLVGLAAALGALNAAVLAAGRWIGAVCMAVMVGAILIQVFWRYVLGNALPWPEEVARFLMLWATGLMAPTAYRQGGFVGIDMVVRLLPRVVAAGLTLLLLGVALAVLLVGFRIGWAEVTGFGGRFEMDAFRVPTGWGAEGLEWTKVTRAWMMASLAVGVTIMIAVTVELMLRCVATMVGAGDRLPAIAGAAVGGAE
ncbi:MAG: TRAP transporter small permease subunit [Paracoccaceae bacterium]|nr:MAG: TRAP transporter small permease subunit [Paracoccaceae bacterium]